MLDQGKLKDQIKQAFDEIFPKAFETAFFKIMPEETKDGLEKAENFGKTINDLIADPMSERLASAIDYYVHSAEVFGQFMILGVATVGSMCAQTQVVPLPITIQTMPTGLGGGAMPLPNTLILGIK